MDRAPTSARENELGILDPSRLPGHVLEELSKQSYDRSSRYLLVADVLRAAAAGNRPVLDLGGAEGFLNLLLPDHQVVVADIRGPTDVLASGERLPFPDGTFSVGIAVDMLEHIPSEHRDGVLHEMSRTADALVLAGPFDAGPVVAAEDRQRALFQALFGRQHDWLEEHRKFGLPSRQAVIDRLSELGLAVAIVGSNPLPVWEAELEHSYLAVRLGLDPENLPTRARLLTGFFSEADSTPPSYRSILIATRDRTVAESLGRRRTGNDKIRVQAAVREIETASHTLIGSAFDNLRANLETGWKETAERVRELEAELSAANQRFAEIQVSLQESKAESGRNAAEARAQSVTLAQIRLELEQRPTERTLVALEQLLGAINGYSLLVAGPPVTSRDQISPTSEPRMTYSAWRASRTPASLPPGAQSAVRFSIITPVFNPDARQLTECIRSVRAQTYDGWELVLVNASTAPHVHAICRRFGQLDDRVKILERENEGIALNTNAGVDGSVNEWILFLDHDDTLEPHALAAFVEAITGRVQLELAYADEDKLDEAGNYTEPLFKPDWSPDLLRNVNYIGHPLCIKRPLFERIGGVRAGFEGAQDYDLVLRATSAARDIVHIPDVLYHWRQHAGSTALDISVKPGAHSAGRRALHDFLQQECPGAWVEPGATLTNHRARYPLRNAVVSIVIPFRDGWRLTEACLESIARTRGPLPIEVLLVSNQSQEAETHARMLRWRDRWDWIRLLEFDRPFNFQQLNNWAATRATGELLLFLNNDTEALHAGWIEALAENAQRREIGAVGGRLFYPNGLVQHAGVVVGIGGFADHPWGGMDPNAWTPAGPSYWTRDFLAVTAACLMVEREKFERVGGFDERFTVCGGDVDLCLRLHETGLWNMMSPFVRLIHHESITRAPAPPESDIRESLRAYAPYLGGRDPFFNPNLTLRDRSCELAIDERPR